MCIRDSLEERLIKPSSAEYIRREVVIAENVSTFDPLKLEGQTVYKSTDVGTNASVSEVEILSRDNKTYYKISFFVGFSDRDLIEGLFTVPGKTKVIESVPVAGISTITVDSTIGFGSTGTIISGANTIDYTSKSINQFFGCTGINNAISIADDIRSQEVVYGFEDGDLSKKVELRITGVLSEFVPVDVSLVREGEKIFVKNVGNKIDNPDSEKTYKEVFANSWIYNTSSRYFVEEIKSGRFVLNSKIDKSSLKVGDTFSVLRRNSQFIEATGIIGDVGEQANDVRIDNLGSWTPVAGRYYDIRRVLDKSTSSGLKLFKGNDSIVSNILNVYTDSNKEGYVASNSLPSYDIKTDIIKYSISSANDTGIGLSLIHI